MNNINIVSDDDYVDPMRRLYTAESGLRYPERLPESLSRPHRPDAALLLDDYDSSGDGADDSEPDSARCARPLRENRTNV